jgi:hypothetical protein
MEGKSEHIISLAKEIMDDVELKRVNAQSILLKATRLARYVDNEEVRKWLRLEMQGYSSKDEISLKYMLKTRRWIDKAKGEGYWAPLSQLVALKESYTVKLKLYSIPNTENAPIINGIKYAINDTANSIARFEGIESTVVSLLHDFATSVYYERVFDGLAESIFDAYKKDVDLLIAENTGDVLNKISYVINGITDGGTEAISQALSTCRRIIDSFADCISPPQNNPIQTEEGKSISVKKDKVLNRIVTYTRDKCTSNSRFEKIRDNITHLYSRVSAGVHNDIDGSEAKNLFFNTYLILGEILSLKK